MHYFKRSIPKGYQIYASFEVAGLHLSHRREALDEFLRGINLDIVFRPEPLNAHDGNAILIIGEYENRPLLAEDPKPPRASVVLGYVPRQDAAALQVTGVLASCIPRLNAVPTLDDNWVSVVVDALGPRDKSISNRYFAYIAAQWNNAPARFQDVLYIKLCGEKSKRGMTNREATECVQRLRTEFELKSPGRALELDARLRIVESLFDEFSDSENADSYDLRKVPVATVVSAALALFDKGRTAADIEDDYELVADKIREIRPSLVKR